MTNGARLEVWDAAACQRVHDAAVAVLERCGVEVHYGPALELFAAAGARVDDSRVRITGDLVAKAMRSAPKSWSVRSRGRDEVVELRDGAGPYYGTGSDCLYVTDPETNERRRVRVADVEAMASTCEKLPNVDFVMSMGLPEDAAQAVDDLAQVAAMLKGTRKPLIVAPRDGHVLPQIKQMAALAGEADSFMIYAMPSPPLMHDEDALTKVIACAELNVPLIYCPAPSAGATAPCTLTGGVVQGVAETLSGMVLHQHVNPGAPFVYGAGMAVLDMRSAYDPYVTPESLLGLQACCDLARFYDLPSFSYSGMSDSKTLDEQWAVDAAITMACGSLSRATLLHDNGYLESGLRSSHETIVLADELVGFMRHFMQTLRVDDESLAVDEICEVGPGGNHLSRPLTRRNHRSFWRTSLFDHQVFDRWEAAGALTLRERVLNMSAEIQAMPRPFELPDEVLAEFDRILADLMVTR
jgi:trimethylamine--corrinoid protein Co-methyltransferase